MIWPVVILVVLVVFGSVYWMKPSPRDTRLAALRLDAIKRGLHVRQFKFKPESAKNGVRDEVWGTSFTYVKPELKKGGELRFRVVGQAAWDSEGLPEGLAWHDKGTPAEAALLCEKIGTLNDEIIMMEVFENRATIMTAEHKAATAESYEQFLKAFLPE